MNWVDIVIIIFILYFLVMGYFQGFLRGTIELVGLFASFIFARTFYASIAQFISERFNLPIGGSKIIALVAAWFTVYLAYYFLTSYLYGKIPEKVRESKYNRFGGGAPALIKSLLLATIFLLLILVLPIPTNYRDDIKNSRIGGSLVKRGTSVENLLEKEFGGLARDSLTFFTVKPESDETTNLGFKTTRVSTDEISENRMLELVNNERTSRGLAALKMDEKLQSVARAHSTDMFKNGYFSHTSLDGKSPFDRMNLAGISFLIAGENLALAPNVDIAHDGLMNSPGHRANILTPEFRKVGMGVIDGGIYGKMFSQEFTD